MMKIAPLVYLFLLGFICWAGTHSTVLAQADARKITSFDKDWKFLKADAAGAEKVAFDDAGWRKLDVPHDWSIEGPYDRNNPTGRGGGYLPAGIGWYRKAFTLTDADARKLHFIEFDGVMANSDVWINGVHLGKRPFGYISFGYELTKHLNFGKGKTNVIAVRADNSIQPASRYYTGAGLYRHVRLVSVNPVHLVKWSVFVTTPVATAQKASVNLKAQVNNQSAASGEYSLETTILDPSGKEVQKTETKQTAPAGKIIDVEQQLELSNPKLWGVEQPNVYQALTRVKSGKTVVDEQITTFGIREARFEAATGFWLNGENLKIKGVCLHHDGGAVGAAVPLGVWEQRFKLLKEAGVNGIRVGHNPFAPEFLDLCDRLGFLVMNETFDTWTAAKNHGEKGYNLHFTEWWEKDTRDLALRDRNHPSVVIYSVGNEIRDNLDSPEGFKKYKDQQDLLHRLDPTRPVTMGLFRPNSSKVYTNGFAEMMDVVGQNYREAELVAAHEANPHWKVLGTENAHVLEQWLVLRDKPYMAGQFLWTGFDYLGEANWPETTNNSGLFDRVGNWKQQGLQRHSWWSEEPVVHIVRKSDNAGAGDWVADWTPIDFDTYDNARVQVYSNCEEVELFLNGKSLGTKPKPANDSPCEWDVTFEEGTIKAVGRNKGKEAASESFTSAGAPAHLVLSATKPTISHNWDDVTFITATVVDANGVVCPNADKMVKFDISGPGVITAVDNGNILSHEPYQASERRAYRGKSVAIIKASKPGGKMTITATADGLTAGTVSVAVKP
ncbi:glycoside hydrolase family 2 TIM barrel-domain containing protein [Pontibacter beigongshangensis]|uniref:glycoside hydrolase family 2 TIM barrel-domain containing protein n=1 Tax=Pontibacter beigongshangensis TaxID=2574733 RepID=UPI001F510A96|nr:glycoside hydrolase family 2 TIM barrel-domain containing protein [Pontibacter beigongshangensis]